MKLPKREDKFVIAEKTSPCYGNVVSGIHLDVRGDDYHPNRIWYYVCVDRAYSGDVISCYCGIVYASCTLKGALDYVAHCLTPYQEQEEKTDEELAAEAVESSNRDEVLEGSGAVKLSGTVPDDPDTENPLCSCSSGNTANCSDKILRGCVIPEAAAALDHVFDSFSSLAADLLHMQYVLAPAPSGEGGGAYV